MQGLGGHYLRDLQNQNVEVLSVQLQAKLCHSVSLGS